VDGYERQGHVMGIGLSIILVVAGAILAFAVRATSFYGIDVHVVGWILMAAGALGLIWSLVISWSRRRTVLLEPRHEAVTRVVDHDLPVENVVRRDPR
jgi:uncharacterized membrane protein YbhN (UPF0104 family)